MSAKLGSLSIACVQLGPRKLSVIRSREGDREASTILNGDAVETSVRHRQGGRSSAICTVLI